MAIPARPSLNSVLESSHLLQSLSAADRELLAGFSILSQVRKGDTIWTTGAQVDFFALVGKGFVKMVRTGSRGHELTHEIMGPGQILGLLGTVDGTGCPLEARAVSAVWYLRIPKAQFIPIYERTPVLKDHMIKRTTVRLRKAQEMLNRMSNRSVESRISAILMMLAESYGEPDGEAIRIMVPLTRQEVADMAGTTVESAIRTLSKWQKLGWVSTTSREMKLLQTDLLVSLLR